MRKLMCCILLSAIQVFSEKIQVDQGSNAVLFNNATADNRENEVSLYINGYSIPAHIVKWTFENGDIKTTWSMYNYTKLYMDANRNIMIANIDKNYEGKYRLQSSQIRAVDLTILTINNSTVTPTTVKDVKDGTGIITKSVCLEDSVKLFENITFNSQYTVVSLYMNHHVHTLMATWDGQNSIINSRILPEYKEKVYLNKDGSIWIQNVNHWDEENYFILYDRGTSLKYEAKIYIKVAPEKNCRPKIRHLDKTLIAYLEDEYCGKPVASLEWLAHPGILNTSKPVINLSPGKESGTYYACLKGPALECAKISTLSDYCSSYTIEGNDSPTLASDILDLKISISLILTSMSVISSLVLLIVALYSIPKIWRCRVGLTSQRSQAECRPNLENENEEQEILMMNMPKPLTKEFGNLKWENMVEMLNSDQQQGLRRHCEFLNGKYPQLWLRHFGNLKWENMVELLNSDQQQGLRRHCEVINGEYPQLWLRHFGSLQWENIMQLLNGNQQQGLRKHCEGLIQEYPQLWQNHFVNLTWENILQMLNVNQQKDLRKHCERLIEEYPQLWKNYFAKLKWENIMQLLNGDQRQGFQKHCDAEAEKIKDREPSKRQKQKMMERTVEVSKDVYRYLLYNKKFDPNVME